jgi:hypothetical protein
MSVSEAVLSKAVADRRAALNRVAELEKALAATGYPVLDHDAWVSMGREIGALRRIKEAAKAVAEFDPNTYETEDEAGFVFQNHVLPALRKALEDEHVRP